MRCVSNSTAKTATAIVQVEGENGSFVISLNRRIRDFAQSQSQCEYCMIKRIFVLSCYSYLKSRTSSWLRIHVDFWSARRPNFPSLQLILIVGSDTLYMTLAALVWDSQVIVWTMSEFFVFSNLQSTSSIQFFQTLRSCYHDIHRWNLVFCWLQWLWRTRTFPRLPCTQNAQKLLKSQ